MDQEDEPKAQRTPLDYVLHISYGKRADRAPQKSALLVDSGCRCGVT